MPVIDKRTMNIKTPLIFCPQCGTPGGQPVAGEADKYECPSCKTQFAISRADAREPNDRQRYEQTVAGGSRGKAAQKGRKRHWLAAVVAMGVAAVLLTPLLRSQSPAPVVKAQSMGSLLQATVFDNGGKISFIELYESRNADTANFVIRATDMQTGKLLSEPLRLSLAPGNGRGEFKQFSDGQLYLVLQERQLMRFDAGAQQFVDITSTLPERFGQELGAGLSELKFAFHAYPDSFEAVTREGKKYYVYWLINQIRADDDFGAVYEKAVKNFSQTSKFYRFGPVGSGTSTRYQLIQYWAKTEPGQPLYQGYFELYPRSGDAALDRRMKRIDVGSGYSVSPYVISRGLVKIEAIAPLALRFDAQILAQNDKRLLLAYNSTPTGEDGRVLQLMDKDTHQIVWSRTAEQIPSLAKSSRGRYTVGTALPSGFYLAADAGLPGLIVDNDGNIVHDFAMNKSRPSSQSRR